MGQKVEEHLRLNQYQQPTLESNICRKSFCLEVDKLQAFQTSAAFKQLQVGILKAQMGVSMLLLSSMSWVDKAMYDSQMLMSSANNSFLLGRGS